MVVLQQFVESPKQHNSFQSDLYCTLFHYYCNKSVDSCVLQFENSAVVLDSQFIDNRKITDIMHKYLPVIDNSQKAVICKSWNFYSDLKIDS